MTEAEFAGPVENARGALEAHSRDDADLTRPVFEEASDGPAHLPSWVSVCIVSYKGQQVWNLDRLHSHVLPVARGVPPCAKTNRARAGCCKSARSVSSAVARSAARPSPREGAQER